MQYFGKILLFLGIVFIILGLFFILGSKFGQFRFLPGDIYIKKKNFVFFFPVMTSILLSLMITLVLWLFHWWFRK